MLKSFQHPIIKVATIHNGFASYPSHEWDGNEGVLNVKLPSLPSVLTDGRRHDLKGEISAWRYC